MSDEAFLAELTQKLREFGTELQLTTLPTLKGDVTNLKTTFEALMGILKKKGLLSDDPYQHAEKISEIETVPNDPFMENQRMTVVSIRMHHFDSQISYLADYFL